MKNGIYIKYVLFLLCLLPCYSLAQGITQAEYWFDTDYANKVVSKMNGGETFEIVSKVPTAQLDDGIHQFNFRVLQSDGMYSPILSRVFFKSAASKSSMLEYWFDDEYSMRVSAALSSPDEEGNVGMSLDLSDNTKFPIGNHQLHLRVTNSHGISAVYTSSVLKLMSGKIELLEYWLDDDNSNVGYIYGKNVDGGKSFAEQVDLSKASEGVHRLNYRGVSVSGGSSTAISSIPIMVKPRHNFNPAQQKVVSYSVAVDNEPALVYNVMEPAAEIIQPNILNGKDLKVGSHKVTVKAWNTAGAGVSDTKTFKVSKQEPPKLELTAFVDDGVVFLDMNSVPGGQDYEICKVVQWRRKNTEYIPVYKGQQPYPNLNITYDVPDEEGTYEYIGRCWYYDSNRQKKTLESAVVKATVETAFKDKNNLGYILGEILTPVGKLASVELYDKEGNRIPNSYVGIDYETNTFKTPKFPVGTMLTLKIDNFGDERYIYKNETVTIKAGRNDVTMQGMKVDGAVAQPDNYAADLYIDSDVSYVPHQYFRFKLKNESMRQWKGLARIRIIRQSKDNRSSSDRDKNQQYFYVEQGQDEWAVNESKEVTIPLTFLSVSETEDYNIYFETLESGSNEVKRIGLTTRKELNIDSNPYVYTLEKNIDGYKSTSELAVEMADLALATMMLKSEYFDERLGNVREFLSQVKKGVEDAQFNISLNEEEKKWVASLDPDIWTYESLVVRIREHYNGKPRDDVKGLARIISDVLQKNPEALQYIIEQRTEMSLTLQDMLGPLYHIGAGVSKVYDVWEKFEKYYDTVTGIISNIREYQQMDPHTQYFYKARTFINVASEAVTMISSDFAPFARILKTYMDIAEKTVDYALDNEKYKYQHEESWLLVNNKQVGSDYLYKYKNDLNVNFRVEVRKPFHLLGLNVGNISYFDFTDVEVQKQILETKIILSDQKNDRIYDVIHCSQSFDKSGFYFIPDVYENNGGILDGINTPLQKLWMVIRWKNGRTSIIPLKDECDGVKREGVKFTTDNGPHYTVIFDSDSNKPDRMADVLYLAGDKEDNKK